MPRITFKAGKKPKRKEKQTKRKVSKSKLYPLRCAPGRQHKFCLLYTSDAADE